ncbi:MAG: PilW family protein [Woeseia sp.]
MSGFYRSSARSRQQGVTLVELMVSLLLGLLLTAGIIQVFAGNRITYAFNEGFSRIQENARFSLDHMAYNARMAGYSGCLSDVVVYNNLDAPDSFRDDIDNGLTGFNANGTGVGENYAAGATDPAPSSDVNAWTPSLPAQLANQVLPGSDVLVIRAIAGDSQELVSPYSDSSQLFVEDPKDFVEGEIMVVTDCQKASVFQLTNVTDTGFGVNLVHSNDGKYVPGNASPTWGSEQSYGLGAEVARLHTYAFYVGRGASNRPALFQLRLQLQSGTASGFVPEELVDGVETMQIRYGLDSDADGAINSWIAANAVADWKAIVAVELSLLTRAPEEYGAETDSAQYNLGGTQFDPVDDRRLRQVFSTTIGVRNRLP